MSMCQLIKVGIVRDGPTNERPSMTTPSDVVGLLDDLRTLDREAFICLQLDARNKVIAREDVSTGSLNASFVHPRELFKAAILNNAASVILAHNHPSQDTTPSAEDIDLTRRMVNAGEILGIEVLDHLIIAGQRFLSLKEAQIF